MQAVHHEAVQLVRQFHTAPPQHQAHLATALVKFCSRQPQGREWQDAGGRAGVVAALVQAVKICDTALQINAVRALQVLISNHDDNRSAAAAAGAIPLLMTIMISLPETEL